jgi:hypothetical protein
LEQPTRPASRVVGGGVVRVGRAGDQPDPVELAQIANPVVVGRNPVSRHVLAEPAANGVKLAMTGMGGLPVADQSDGHAHER